MTWSGFDPASWQPGKKTKSLLALPGACSQSMKLSELLKAMSSRAKAWADGGIFLFSTISLLASRHRSAMGKFSGQISVHNPQRLQELIMRFAA